MHACPLALAGSRVTGPRIDWRAVFMGDAERRDKIAQWGRAVAIACDSGS